MTQYVPFDRASPDPSPRPGVGQLFFSRKCGCNAIETGLRVLADKPLHPRQFVDTSVTPWKLFWRSQETWKVVPAPTLPEIGRA